MDRFYYRATVDEAEQIIKTEAIEAKRPDGRFSPSSGPYFALNNTIQASSWLNSVWPSQNGTVLFEFTSPLRPDSSYNTTTYAALVGSGDARSMSAHILTLDAGLTGEKVATIVAPQQNGLQLKAVTGAQLLSQRAQDKIAAMTGQFADGYISIV